MIRKVHEVDPLLCPQCGGTMKVIAFLLDYPLAWISTDHYSVKQGWSEGAII